MLLTFEPIEELPDASPPEGEKGGIPWTSRIIPLLPYGVFAALFAVTYKRWFLPFQDHAREVMVPERLLHGEVLYRDVGSSYGPLPPYLDAGALRLFGEQLDVLIALRTVIALLGVAALLRLSNRLVREPIAASALTSFIVAATFFGFGSPYVFPYSVAALEGTVGIWWSLELALGSKGWRRSLAAGLLAGIAGCSKVELLPAALSGTGLALFWRRPRFEAVTSCLLALSVGVMGLGLPVLLLGVETLRRHGFLLAFESPASWRHFYSSVIFGAPDFGGYLATGLAQTLFPSAPFLLASLALLAIASSSPLWGSAAAAFLAIAAVKIPRNDELHVLIPLAIGLAIWELVVVLWTRAFRDPDSPACARLCVAFSMLFVVWRQPFFIRVPTYSAFATPLALAFCLSFIATRTSPRIARSFPFLVMALCLSQSADRWFESHHFAMRWVSFPRASLFLPVESADLVEETSRILNRFSRPNDYVCIFPEPGFVNFATRRRTPFIDEQFHAGMQDAGAEDEMIQRLRQRPIALALITNRPLGFDGAEYRRGLLDRFFIELDRRMKPVGVIGDLRRPIPGLGQATGAVLYLPREGVSR